MLTKPLLSDTEDRDIEKGTPHEGAMTSTLTAANLAEHDDDDRSVRASGRSLSNYSLGSRNEISSWTSEPSETWSLSNAASETPADTTWYQPIQAWLLEQLIDYLRSLIEELIHLNVPKSLFNKDKLQRWSKKGFAETLVLFMTLTLIEIGIDLLLNPLRKGHQVKLQSVLIEGLISSVPTSIVLHAFLNTLEKTYPHKWERLQTLASYGGFSLLNGELGALIFALMKGQTQQFSSGNVIQAIISAEVVIIALLAMAIGLKSGYQYCFPVTTALQPLSSTSAINNPIHETSANLTAVPDIPQLATANPTITGQ